MLRFHLGTSLSTGFGAAFLFSLLLAIVLHVAVLTELFSVHFLVWTTGGKLGAALLMIAVFAHSFRVKVSVIVLTIRNDLLFPLRGVEVRWIPISVILILIRLLFLRSASFLSSDSCLRRLARL